MGIERFPFVYSFSKMVSKYLRSRDSFWSPVRIQAFVLGQTIHSYNDYKASIKFENL